MLEGPAGYAEPGIVGDIEQPARPLTRTGDGAGKDHLVADHRRKPRQPGKGYRDVRLPFLEGAAANVARNRRQLPVEGNVLAQRDKMDLVVVGDDLALAVD